MYRSYAAGSQCKQTSTILVPLRAAGDGAGHTPPPGGREPHEGRLRHGWCAGGWAGCDEEPCILYICECEFGFMVCVHTGGEDGRRGAAEAAFAWRVRDFMKQQR